MNLDTLRSALEALITKLETAASGNEGHGIFAEGCATGQRGAVELIREALAAPVAGQVAYVPGETLYRITLANDSRASIPCEVSFTSTDGENLYSETATLTPITIPQPAPVGDEREALTDEQAFDYWAYQNEINNPGPDISLHRSAFDAGLKQARAALDRSGGAPEYAPILPSEPGYYWWRQGDDAFAFVVEIVNSWAGLLAAAGQHGWTRTQPVDEMGGYWSRVTEPEWKGEQPLPPPPDRGLCPHCGGRHAPGVPFDKCAPATGDVKTEGGAA